MVLAFFEWNPLKGKEFTGLLNFRTLMQDDLWWTSLKNTIYYIILNVPLIVAAALGLAEIVVSLGRTSKLFRGIYFIPRCSHWWLRGSYGAIC